MRAAACAAPARRRFAPRASSSARFSCRFSSPTSSPQPPPPRRRHGRARRRHGHGRVRFRAGGGRGRGGARRGDERGARARAGRRRGGGRAELPGHGRREAQRPAGGRARAPQRGAAPLVLRVQQRGERAAERARRGGQRLRVPPLRERARARPQRPRRARVLAAHPHAQEIRRRVLVARARRPARPPRSRGCARGAPEHGREVLLPPGVVRGAVRRRRGLLCAGHPPCRAGRRRRSRARAVRGPRLRFGSPRAAWREWGGGGWGAAHRAVTRWDPFQCARSCAPVRPSSAVLRRAVVARGRPALPPLGKLGKLERTAGPPHGRIKMRVPVSCGPGQTRPVFKVRLSQLAAGAAEALFERRDKRAAQAERCRARVNRLPPSGESRTGRVRSWVPAPRSSTRSGPSPGTFPAPGRRRGCIPARPRGTAGQRPRQCRTLPRDALLGGPACPCGGARRGTTHSCISPRSSLARGPAPGLLVRGVVAANRALSPTPCSPFPSPFPCAPPPSPSCPVAGP